MSGSSVNISVLFGPERPGVDLRISAGVEIGRLFKPLRVPGDLDQVVAFDSFSTPSSEVVRRKVEEGDRLFFTRKVEVVVHQAGGQTEVQEFPVFGLDLIYLPTAVRFLIRQRMLAAVWVDGQRLTEASRRGTTVADGHRYEVFTRESSLVVPSRRQNEYPRPGTTNGSFNSRRRRETTLEEAFKLDRNRHNGSRGY
ncbi:MAG: hypothetical protein Q8P13_01795 [bacterium]|nr:hypothetical protein [bacterium]